MAALFNHWSLSYPVVLTCFRRYKRSDWRFCACVIYVKSSISSDTTRHFRYKCYGLFVRKYITSLQSYLSLINTTQTSFDAFFDSIRKSRDSSASQSLTVIYFKKNVISYYIERHFKKLFTVIITGELVNGTWHLYRKYFVVSLDIDDLSFIAHAYKRQS